MQTTTLHTLRRYTNEKLEKTREEYYEAQIELARCDAAATKYDKLYQPGILGSNPWYRMASEAQTKIRHTKQAHEEALAAHQELCKDDIT